LTDRAKDAAQVNPGERGQPHVTDGLRLVDRELQGDGTGVVVAGLTPRPAETCHLVRLGLPKAESS
jgi:hypothetical protein